MLTLAIGDLFIPDRTIDLPNDFKKLLAPNAGSVPSNPKISQVLCLGNVTSSTETLEFLYNISPSFHIVRGEFDDVQILSQQLTRLGHQDADIPFHKVVTIDNLRIGFTSGYQSLPRNDDAALSTLARELDVDILIWGSTHKVEAYAIEGRFFINPGSATGAYTFSWVDEKEDEDEENGSEKSDAQQEKTKNQETTEKKESETVQEADKSEPKTETNTSKTELFGQENTEKSSKSGAHELDLDVLKKVEELTAIIPSFCLLDSSGSSCTLYLYTYLNKEVKVNKVMIPRR